MTGTESLLKQGIAAAKRGQKSQARELLLQVIELDDHDEAAWLWLSGVVDSPSEQLVCLENVLTINPDHATAKRGLDKLIALHPEPSQPEPEPPPPPAAPPPPSWSVSTPEAAPQAPAEEIETRVCASCDNVNPAWRSLCMACGQPVQQPELSATPDAAQDTKICIHCGASNPNWRVLCEMCGKAARGRAGMAQTAPQTPAVPDEPPVEINFTREYGNPHPGLISLGAAWIGAAMFNKRGAYEYEIFGASTGRTIKGILIGTLAVPTLTIILSYFLFMMSGDGNIFISIAILTAGIANLIFSIIPLGLAVVFSFYLYSTIMYAIAHLLGSKTSYTVHGQLLSISISASTLLISIMYFISMAIILALSDVAISESFSLLDILDLGGVVSYILTAGTTGTVLYSLAMQFQAVRVAHRFSEARCAAALGISLLIFLIVEAIFIFILAALWVSLLSGAAILLFP